MVHDSQLSIRRAALALCEPVSTVGRWVKPPSPAGAKRRRNRPVADDPSVRQAIRDLCNDDRHRRHGHRMIRAALVRRIGRPVARKTVARIMREEALGGRRIRRRPGRPKRVARMRPSEQNRAWQIDMTSFQLADLSPVFLVVIIDCHTRQIVGWTLHRRCRASEWTSALRMALESRGLTTKTLCRGLTLRSDNGAQPCSKRFVEYLGRMGVRGEYTGYNAPDDNAHVERVIRTIKEEEVWLNAYETLFEAREAIEAYVRYYNAERLHSALDYRTPDEFAARSSTHLAA
jgi:putative transposase